MELDVEIPKPPVTVEELLELHHFSVTNYGGDAAVRDVGSLEGAAWRPEAGMGDYMLFPQPADKAAALAESILLRHPFADGNKRTALLGAALLLGKHGLWIKSDSEELVEQILGIISRTYTTQDFSQFLEGHTEPTTLSTQPRAVAEQFAAQYGEALAELAR